MSENNTKAVQPPKHAAPAEFERVLIDMPSFKPEPFSERESTGSKFQVYTGRPLQGEILGARNFGAMKDADGRIQTNEDGESRDMIALLIKVETDIDVVGRDDKPAVAKPGDTIYWFPTTQIRQSIMQALRLDADSREESESVFIAALNGEYGLRFWCQPLKQVAHPKHASKGYKMWTYDFRLHPTPVKRVGANGLAKFFQDARRVALAAPANQPNGSHVLDAQNRA
jgi:hypothetical protein